MMCFFWNFTGCCHSKVKPLTQVTQQSTEDRAMVCPRSLVLLTHRMVSCRSLSLLTKRHWQCTFTRSQGPLWPPTCQCGLLHFLLVHNVIRGLAVGDHGTFAILIPPTHPVKVVNLELLPAGQDSASSTVHHSNVMDFNLILLKCQLHFLGFEVLNHVDISVGAERLQLSFAPSRRPASPQQKHRDTEAPFTTARPQAADADGGFGADELDLEASVLLTCSFLLCPWISFKSSFGICRHEALVGWPVLIRDHCDRRVVVTRQLEMNVNPAQLRNS